MNIPPHQLDEALRRVKDGLMQPDEAAKWLLEQSAAADSDSASTESIAIKSDAGSPVPIADLIAQLGPPPEAIQRDWDEQLARLAANYEQSTGRALPELTSRDILVDPNNRLSFSNALLAGLSASASTSAKVLPENQATNPSGGPEFKASSLTTDLIVPVIDKDSEARQISDTKSQHKRRKKTPTDQNDKRKLSFASKRPWLRPVSILVAVASMFGLAVYFLIPASEPESKSKSKSATTAAGPSSIFSPTATKQTSQTSAAPVATRKSRTSADNLLVGEFQLADNADALTPSSEAASSLRPSTDAVDAKPAASKAMLGLDSFAGGNWVSATDLLPTADFDTNTTADNMADSPEAENGSAISASITSDMPDESGAMNAEQADDADGASPDSPTGRASGVTAIELPALPSRAMTDEEIESIAITGTDVQKIELLFPVKTALSLVSDRDGWVVQDNKDQSPLARMFPSDTGLQFRWTALAAARPIAKQVASGVLNLSLRDGTSRPLFLRPVITAEAWSIDLATGDARAAWPITTFVPAGVSRLQLEFQVPETVIQTWVQPHDPAQVRRSQSIVEFALASDSKIAIRSRLEVKTGTRITMRMRHAGQLDPSFPWQSISAPRIQDAVEQVTMQLAQASAEQEQIKIVYYKATTAEKRVLGPQRDAIDSVVLRLRDLSERLTKYEQLLSLLEHAAYMKIHLDVTWPESAPLASQSIFAMDSPQTETP